MIVFCAPLSRRARVAWLMPSLRAKASCVLSPRSARTHLTLDPGAPVEQLFAGGPIHLQVLGVQGSQARLGVAAPIGLHILRGELGHNNPGQSELPRFRAHCHDSLLGCVEQATPV